MQLDLFKFLSHALSDNFDFVLTFFLGMQCDWTEMKQNKPHIPCNK